ncbi:LOW QUALITY PROTEIN: heparan sulfate 2-O-sulfotransferase 1-like [Xenia sp. Carnegie-2017]|uniref:LOW QUALITY PROTEIN: heparan sulfate 2-O-sulfotransferase 1-like n=1 Tax=Xenia sp. Carnegie-2017 TaxID=2897299 RepID=UPI001F048FE0|nr:LOW QUALITY PROTEIN: heparan sulfate 2-O-sulfotransferase 1-like [Xenia sp. Carnegie-2017]
MSHPIIRRICMRATSHQRKYQRRTLAISHFYFRRNTGLTAHHTYINLLRDPVERLVSHYYYTRSLKRLPKRIRRLKSLGHWNVSLEECLSNQYEGCKWNLMTRFFCGPDAICKTGGRKALLQAKHNLLNYYASVGVVEHLSEFVSVLQKRLPEFVAKIKELSKQVLNRGVKKNVQRDVIFLISKLNKADIKLYNFAKELFIKQARSCGVKII